MDSSKEDSVKWYLVFSEDDNSHSIVDQESVINQELANVGDTVTFFYGSKSYFGEIIKIGDRISLDEQLKKIGKKAVRVQKEGESDPTSSVNCKRVSKPISRFAPSQSSTPDDKGKKRKKPSQSAVTKKIREAGADTMNQHVAEQLVKRRVNYISDDSGDEDVPIATIVRKQNHTEERVPRSPSKEELMRQLKEANEKLNSFLQQECKNAASDVNGNNSKADSLQEENSGEFDVPGSPFNDSSNEYADVSGEKSESGDLETESAEKGEEGDYKDKDEEEDYKEEVSAGCNDQLFGKDFSNDTMVKFQDGFYCKKSVLEPALRRSTKPTHLVRRLLEGVFTNEAITKCTLTGQKPRAAGRGNYTGEVKALHRGAIDAIIKFAKRIGKARGWTGFSKEECRGALTQKIGEITRGSKKSAASSPL